MISIAEINLLKSQNEGLKKQNMELQRELIKKEQALEPFNDEYFKGLDTKQIAELAKKSIRLTTENRKLEDTLNNIEKFMIYEFSGQNEWVKTTVLDIIIKSKGANNAN